MTSTMLLPFARPTDHHRAMRPYGGVCVSMMYEAC